MCTVVHLQLTHKTPNVWSYLWLKECSLLYLVSIKKKFQFFPIFFNIYIYRNYTHTLVTYIAL